MKKTLLGLLCAALITGCKKDNDEGAPASSTAAQPSMAALRTHFAAQRQAETQSFTFGGVGGGYFISAHGTLLSVSPLAFRDAAGAPVTGPVTIELVEAYEVSDMLRLNLQTVVMDGDQRTALQSGGELRLRATSNGEQVAVVEHGVLIHVPEQQTVQGMRPYAGEEDDYGVVRWRETGEELLDTTIVYADSTGVVLMSDSGYTGWWPPPPPAWPAYTMFNIDHPLPLTGGGTDVTVNVTNAPNEYSAVVFLVMPSLDCMVYFEVGPITARRAGCLVPLGVQGTVIAVSFGANGEVNAAFVPVTVTQDMQLNVTMQPMTEAEYDAAVEAL